MIRNYVWMDGFIGKWYFVVVGTSLSMLLMLHADPHESETLRPLDMHHGMEVRLGLSKGPVYPSII